MGEENMIARLLGATVLDGEGSRLGPAAAAYVDPDSGHAEWVAVRVDPPTERLAPLARSTSRPGRLVLGVGARAVLEAPAAPKGDLGQQDEDVLYRYYAQVICPVRDPWGPVGADRRLVGAPAHAARLYRVALDVLAPTSASR